MGGSSTASGSHRHGQIWGAPSTRAAAPTSVQFAVSERANFNLTKLVYEEWIGVERLVGLDGYCAYNYQWATGAKSRGAGAVTRGAPVSSQFTVSERTNLHITKFLCG